MKNLAKLQEMMEILIKRRKQQVLHDFISNSQKMKNLAKLQEMMEILIKRRKQQVLHDFISNSKKMKKIGDIYRKVDFMLVKNLKISALAILLKKSENVKIPLKITEFDMFKFTHFFKGKINISLQESFDKIRNFNKYIEKTRNFTKISSFFSFKRNLLLNYAFYKIKNYLTISTERTQLIQSNFFNISTLFMKKSKKNLQKSFNSIKDRYYKKTAIFRLFAVFNRKNLDFSRFFLTKIKHIYDTRMIINEVLGMFSGYFDRLLLKNAFYSIKDYYMRRKQDIELAADNLDDILTRKTLDNEDYAWQKIKKIKGIFKKKQNSAENIAEFFKHKKKILESFFMYKLKNLKNSYNSDKIRLFNQILSTIMLKFKKNHQKLGISLILRKSNRILCIKKLEEFLAFFAKKSAFSQICYFIRKKNDIFSGIQLYLAFERKHILSDIFDKIKNNRDIFIKKQKSIKKILAFITHQKKLLASLFLYKLKNYRNTFNFDKIKLFIKMINALERNSRKNNEKHGFYMIYDRMRKVKSIEKIENIFDFHKKSLFFQQLISNAKNFKKAEKLKEIIENQEIREIHLIFKKILGFALEKVCKLERLAQLLENTLKKRAFDKIKNFADLCILTKFHQKDMSVKQMLFLLKTIFSSRKPLKEAFYSIKDQYMLGKVRMLKYAKFVKILEISLKKQILKKIHWRSYIISNLKEFIENMQNIFKKQVFQAIQRYSDEKTQKNENIFKLADLYENLQKRVKYDAFKQIIENSSDFLRKMEKMQENLQKSLKIQNFLSRLLAFYKIKKYTEMENIAKMREFLEKRSNSLQHLLKLLKRKLKANKKAGFDEIKEKSKKSQQNPVFDENIFETKIIPEFEADIYNRPEDREIPKKEEISLNSLKILFNLFEKLGYKRYSLLYYAFSKLLKKPYLPPTHPISNTIAIPIKYDEIPKKDHSFLGLFDGNDGFLKDSFGMSPISTRKNMFFDKISSSPLIVKPKANIKKNLIADKLIKAPYTAAKEGNSGAGERPEKKNMGFTQDLKESAINDDRTIDDSMNLNRSNFKNIPKYLQFSLFSR